MGYIWQSYVGRLYFYKREITPMKFFSINIILNSALLSLALSITIIPMAQQYTGKEKDKKQLSALMNEIMMASKKSDTAFIKKIYADDYMFTGPNGTQNNKQQLIEWITLKPFVFELHSLKYQIYQNAAVVSGIIKSKLFNDRRFTSFWIKKLKQWQVVAWHASTIENE